MTRYPATPKEFLSRYPDTVFDKGPHRQGDYNNDGMGDLVFPIVGFDQNAPKTGEVSVSSGWNAKTIISVTGEAPNDMFGRVAVSAGDVNGDGFDDLAVSAPASSAIAQEAGRAYIYSGQDGSLLMRVSESQTLAALGWSMASAGDTNSDGLDDVIIGAPMGPTSGKAYLFHGRADPTAPVDLDVANADFTFSGETLQDAFGFVVDSAGDFNGDGSQDIIVGAPFYGRGPNNDLPGRGAAYIYSGLTGELLLKISGASQGMIVGNDVSPAGDVNGDGKADVIVTAPGKLAIDAQGVATNTSASFIIFGRASAATPEIITSDNADISLAPTVAGDFTFGATAELGNDVNGDGRPEFFITAGFLITVNSQLQLAQRTYIYSGASAQLLATFKSGEPFPDLAPPADDE